MHEEYLAGVLLLLLLLLQLLDPFYLSLLKGQV
jgi:hypothetical protein